MAIAITGIEKQGPVIVCSTNDSKNRTYKVDFKEGKIYGISHKELKNSKSILGKIPSTIASKNPFFFALRLLTDKRDPRYYNVVESLLSYPDLLSYLTDPRMISDIIANYDGKLPKGYVNWCRKENQMFSYESLQVFVDNKELSQWPQTLAEAVQRFFDGTGYNIAKKTNYDKELCACLMRIIACSLKRYEIKNLISKLTNIIQILKDYPQLRPYLDDTKSAQSAYQILKDTLDKERNEKILVNEAKIAALNGTIIDGFIIKIPSSMDDFAKEGKQQHNCVGYYYHELIAAGYALIYFLRHPENPSQSYVTCRFRIEDKQTVEHRLCRNEWFDGHDDLFKKIDDMINNLLDA